MPGCGRDTAFPSTGDRVVRISQIKKAQKNIEEGAWVSQIPNLPGVRLKVKGLFNSDAARMYAEARLAMTDEDFKNEKVQEELDIRIMAEAVLVDWDGIDDDSAQEEADGDYPPLAYDPEIAKIVLADPEMVLLRQGVRFAASNVAQLGKERLEDAAKN